MLRSNVQLNGLSRVHFYSFQRQIHSTLSRRALDRVSPASASAAPTGNFTYTKQVDIHHEPDVSPSTGKQMYVVSPKESVEHDVPGGPYPTADPYVMPAVTDPPPKVDEVELSSTSPGVAHPNTTKRVPQNPGGVGYSAAVRYRTAPGTMKEGSNGGLSLMDESTTVGSNRLAQRNSPPDLK